MTDREAIRKVIELVERLAYTTDIDLLSKDARELRRDYERFSVEPAAPTPLTRSVKCSCGGWYIHGSDHRCYPDAAPPVTREQEETFAERAVQLIEENANDDLRDEMNRDQPAFFRAVADALEGE